MLRNVGENLALQGEFGRSDFLFSLFLPLHSRPAFLNSSYCWVLGSESPSTGKHLQGRGGWKIQAVSWKVIASLQEKGWAPGPAWQQTLALGKHPLQVWYAAEVGRSPWFFSTLSPPPIPRGIVKFTCLSFESYLFCLGCPSPSLLGTLTVWNWTGKTEGPHLAIHRSS